MTDNMLKKEEQKMHTAIGFTNQDTHDSSPATDNKACLNPEDLVKYGFIRELVGRITSVERLEGLTLDDFYNIIVNPGNSPIYGYKQFFKGLGINLTFTEPALKEIVRLAYSMDTGARGINSILKKVVEPVTFSIDKIQEDLIESEKNNPAVSDNFKESIVIDFNPSDLFLIIKENKKGKVKSREIIAPIYNQTAV
jgi:ATP-dependent Clp protease ATP-binding subunit ClpX